MRNSKFLMFTIVAFAFFLRFYDVTKTTDLYIDEVAIGLNAHTLVTSLSDEFGTRFPLFFKSYGDYKSPVYIYSVAFFELLLGKSALAIRLPSVIAGSFSVLLVGLILLRLQAPKKVSILSMLLVAISPWAIQFSRAGFEANLALTLILGGTYNILVYFETGKRRLALGLTLFLLALYTYQFSRILVPGIMSFWFLVYFFYMYKNRLKEHKLKLWESAWIVLLVVCAINFYVFAFSPLGMTRARTESFLTEAPKTLTKFSSISVWALNRFAHNYISYYSPIFLFFMGDGIGRHTLPDFGILFLWEFPFFYHGLYQTIRNHNKRYMQLMLALALLGPLAASFGRPSPHALRALPLVAPFTFFIALSLSQLKSKKIIFVLTGFVGLSMLTYLQTYYVYYKHFTGPDWSDGNREAIEYAQKHKYEYSSVNITPDMEHGDTFVLYYTDISPQTRQWEKGDPYFDRYTFNSGPCTEPRNLRTLCITSTKEEKVSGKLLTVINNRAGDPIWNIWEN